MQNVFVKIAAIGFVALLAGWQAPAVAKCGGKDIIAELQRDPAAKARLKAAEAKAINGNAVLWRIEKAGLDDSYLLGTIHTNERDTAWITPQLDKALKSVDRVAIEVLDAEAGLAKLMLANLKMFMSPDGSQGTRALLDTDEFEQLVKAAQKIDPAMNAQALAVMRPWFATLLFALPPCEIALKRKGGRVFDTLVKDTAVANGAKAFGLESAVEQISAFANQPLSDQVTMLRSTLKTIDRAEDVLFTTKRLYVTRRLGLLPTLSIEIAGPDARAASERFLETVLDKRNLKMRDRALPLLAKGRTMIAVGAGHLVGPTGFVKLFRDAGYTLTPIE